MMKKINYKQKILDLDERRQIVKKGEINKCPPPQKITKLPPLHRLLFSFSYLSFTPFFRTTDARDVERYHDCSSKSKTFIYNDGGVSGSLYSCIYA